MRLTRIAITGADDHVDPLALFDLSLEFPFAEWAFLRGGEDRNGAPRYPSTAWIAKAMEFIHAHEPKPQWALHLCGPVARAAMAGSPPLFSALRSAEVPRVQLNGYSKFRLPMLLLAQLLPQTEFILQVQRFDAFENVDFLHRQHQNVSALWDSSGGRGVDDGWATIPHPTVGGGPGLGWAGGITEENIVQKIELIQRDNDLPALRDTPYWLDLESGARTDDKFDLAKVRRILELAKPFISEAA